MRRGGVLLTLVTTLVAGLAGGAGTSHAQTAPADATTTTTPPTTTTAPPASPSSVPDVPPAGAPAAQPAPAGPEAAPSEPQPDTGPVEAPPDNAVDHPVGSGYVPSGSNSTSALLEALRALENIGFTPEEAALAGMGHFPVAGYATFSDDWHAPRGTAENPRLHMGTDIFAHFGTPVRAPFDGVVRLSEEGLGGKAAYVTTPDGTYYYMAHLMAFAPGLPSGAPVKQGQVVGLVGDSGNAVGGAPHAHFEVHPGGGAAVNPKPILDAWLAEALAAANALAPAYQAVEGGGASSMVLAMSLVRRFDGRPPAAQPRPEAPPVLWASPVSPAGSAMRVAEAQAERAAASIDWAQRAREARRRAALLTPLTPAALGSLVAPSAGVA